MANSTTTRTPSFPGAASLVPARRFAPEWREREKRERAATITFGGDLASQTARPHTFSFVPGADASRWPMFDEDSGPEVRSWAIADSSVIPPPPNTPASHLVRRRQTLLHHARVECFQDRAGTAMRDVLENLPFRIDPITKVIRSGLFINYRSAYKLPSHGGLVADGKSRRRLGPKRPTWLDLLPAKTHAAQLSLRKRKRNPREDAGAPSAMLKRKFKDAAWADYIDQLYEKEVKRAKIEAANMERHELTATRDSLNRPANQVIDIHIGETLEERVKAELTQRDGKIKRLSKKLTKPIRKAKFHEPELLLPVDQRSIRTEDFVIVPSRRAKIGHKIKETVDKLKERAEGVKDKVRGKFGKKSKNEDNMPLLQVVHF